MQSVSSGTVIERMEDVLRAMGGTIGNIERPLQDASEAPLAPLREAR
jgi:hypothetical protein